MSLYNYEKEVCNASENQANDLEKIGKIGNTPLSELIQVSGKYDPKGPAIGAKNIKKIIKGICPETYMIKVSSCRYSMGDSINISLIYDKNASQAEIDKFKQLAQDISKIVKVFSCKGNDSMDDSSFAISNVINDKFGGADYVSCSARSYYDEEFESFKKHERKTVEKEKKVLMKALEKAAKKEAKAKNKNPESEISPAPLKKRI